MLLTQAAFVHKLRIQRCSAVGTQYGRKQIDIEERGENAVHQQLQEKEGANQTLRDPARDSDCKIIAQILLQSFPNLHFLHPLICIIHPYMLLLSRCLRSTRYVCSLNVYAPLGLYTTRDEYLRVWAFWVSWHVWAF